MVSITAIGSTMEQSSISTLDGDILYVGGGGDGNYTRIQDAIDNASDGDTVFVYDDSSPYYERIIVNKEVSVIGENKETTVIDGDYEGIPIRINSDNCFISGFSVRNCAEIWNDFAQAVIQVSNHENVTVEENIITVGDIPTHNSWHGAIDLISSNHCTIRNNYVYEVKRKSRSIGILLRDDSTQNNIVRNNVSNYIIGIGVADYYSCYNNTYSENHVHHNMFGFSISGEYQRIVDNKVTDNEFNGILCEKLQKSIISGNIVVRNGEGVHFDCGIMLTIDSNYNVISDNLIFQNNPDGLFILDSIRNDIRRNNFIDNEEKNAFFHYASGLLKRNSWQDNYWSDSNSDGLPYFILGEKSIFGIIYWSWINIDWNPAIEPYEIT